MSTLRQEIIESQKIRADFLKWKLIIVSVLGGVALGLSGQAVGGNFSLALALIPPACLYVDVLCAHNSLRIIVIGAFKRKSKCCVGSVADCDCEYESFAKRCADTPAEAFSMEDAVLFYFTNLVSALVALLGVAILCDAEAVLDLTFAKQPQPQGIMGWPFVASGISVIWGGVLTQRRFDQRVKAIESQEIDGMPPLPQTPGR